MNILSRILYRFFVKPHLEEYREIQEDYLEIYIHVYNLPEPREQYSWDTLSDSELKELALRGWAKAPDFDPHDTVRRPIRHIQNIQNFIKFALFLFFLVAAGLGWGIHQWALSGITIVGSATKWVISSIPADIVAGVSIYWYLLSTDTGIVQRMNEELSISPNRINTESRNTDTLFAFYVWNQSLNSRKKWPVVMFLMLIKLLSARIYRTVMRTLQSHMDVFFTSDGLVDLFGNIWARYTKGQKREGLAED